jgi:hypothetical protein
MRGWRRLRPLVVATLFLLLVPVPLASARSAATPTPAVASGIPDGAALAARGTEPQLPAPAAWPFPDAFPRTSGSGHLARGALEWTDFLYDDHGATGATTNGQMGSGGRWKGTYNYASPAAHGNGADIFRLGVGIADGMTHWRVDWVTLDAPGSIPVISFGVVDPTSTAPVAWPGGAGVTVNGLLATVTASAKGAWLVQPSGTAKPVSQLGGTSHVDLKSRSFLVSLPRKALPARDVIRVAAVSGVADDTGHGFAPVPQTNGALQGQPAVYNVGFRSQAQEPPAGSPWMESAQAAALTNGDVNAFGAQIDWRTLASGATTPEPRPSGYTNRWYVSTLRRGEGIITADVSASDGTTTMPGRLLPYAAYVPKAVATGKPLPLTWALHALGYQHNMYAPNPKFLDAACEQRGSLCISPSGRSPSNPWYTDAELDFWQVWRDVAAHFPLDPNRTVIAGYSMGGLGSLRLGLAYPAAFSQVVSIAGGLDCGVYATHGAGVFGANKDCQDNPNFTPMLPSGRWTPFLLGSNGADELSPAANGAQRMTEIRGLGYRYRWEVWSAQDHLLPLSLDTYASIAKSMTSTPLPARPDKVDYAWYPTTVHRDIGLVPGQVYWLDDLSARTPTPGQVAQVEADSAALALPEPTLVESTPAVEQPPGEVPKVVTEGRWQNGAARPRSNAVSLSATGVAAATVDGALAGLRTDRRLVLDLTSDGSLAVVLALPGLGKALPSNCAQATPTATGARVTVAAGHCQVVFAARAAGSIRPTGASAGALPTTGPPDAVLLLGSLLLGLALVLVRAIGARPPA